MIEERMIEERRRVELSREQNRIERYKRVEESALSYVRATESTGRR
jgi:hypothetical protein